MKSNRSSLNTLGIVLGVLAIAIVVFSLVYLLWLQPFYRGSSYRVGDFGFGGGAFGAGVSQEATESVPGAFDKLNVRNISGPIRVESWDKDFIQVHYIKEARTEQWLKEFEIRIRPQGSTLNVEPIYQPSGGTRFGPVSFDIMVPASVQQVVASNISGRIELQNMASPTEQDLETVSGRIQTERASSLRAKSISGSIDFDFAGQDLNVSSTSGSVEGRIDALTAGGSVRVNTISGAVDLHVFDNLDASLKLHSVSGSISVDFPVTVLEQKRNSLDATVGAGTIPFEVQTVSGSIDVGK
jgi:hypothetical protein